jgi:hypothetical protein
MPALRGYPESIGWVRTSLPSQMRQASLALRHGLAPRPSKVMADPPALWHAHLTIARSCGRGVISETHHEYTRTMCEWNGKIHLAGAIPQRGLESTKREPFRNRPGHAACNRLSTPVQTMTTAEG